MADHEFVLEKLSIDVSNANADPEDPDPANPANMTAVVNWTVAGETYKVTLPAMLHDEIRQLLSRFDYEIARHKTATTLVGGDAFTVELIP